MSIVLVFRPRQWELWCLDCGAAADVGVAIEPSGTTELTSLGCDPKALARDRYVCRVRGPVASEKRRLHVHHRRPGGSADSLLITLCASHHLRIHCLRVAGNMQPQLLLVLWREQHPTAAEQLALAFAPLRSLELAA